VSLEDSRSLFLAVRLRGSPGGDEFHTSPKRKRGNQFRPALALRASVVNVKLYSYRRASALSEPDDPMLR
jgi:hypothetical protein